MATQGERAFPTVESVRAARMLRIEIIEQGGNTHEVAVYSGEGAGTWMFSIKVEGKLRAEGVGKAIRALERSPQYMLAMMDAKVMS